MTRRFKGTFGGMRTDTIRLSALDTRAMEIQQLQSANPYMTRAEAQAALAKAEASQKTKR